MVSVEAAATAVAVWVQVLEEEAEVAVAVVEATREEAWDEEVEEVAEMAAAALAGTATGLRSARVGCFGSSCSHSRSSARRSLGENCRASATGVKNTKTCRPMAIR